MPCHYSAPTHPGPTHSSEVNLETIGKAAKHAQLKSSKNATTGTSLDQYLLVHTVNSQGTRDEPNPMPINMKNCSNATTADDA